MAHCNSHCIDRVVGSLIRSMTQPGCAHPRETGGFTRGLGSSTITCSSVCERMPTRLSDPLPMHEPSRLSDRRSNHSFLLCEMDIAMNDFPGRRSKDHSLTSRSAITPPHTATVSDVRIGCGDVWRDESAWDRGHIEQMMEQSHPDADPQSPIYIGGRDASTLSSLPNQDNISPRRRQYCFSTLHNLHTYTHSSHRHVRGPGTARRMANTVHNSSAIDRRQLRVVAVEAHQHTNELPDTSNTL